MIKAVTANPHPQTRIALDQIGPGATPRWSKYRCDPAAVSPPKTVTPATIAAPTPMRAAGRPTSDGHIRLDEPG